MITITKEQLLARAREKVKSLEFAVTQTAFADARAELEEELELARIALASLEAEPVAWRYRYVHTPKTEEHGSPFTTEWKLCDSEDECNPSDCFERQPLFAAPPAPVSVPECFNRLLHHAYGMTMGHDWNIGTMAGYHRTKLCQAVEECRAAMLQGADGNSPVIPDGWVVVPVEPTAEMYDAGDQQLATKQVWDAMIAAAPQQEA